MDLYHPTSYPGLNISSMQINFKLIIDGESRKSREQQGRFNVLGLQNVFFTKIIHFLKEFPKISLV